MLLNKFIILQILNLLTIHAIINKNSKSTGKKLYKTLPAGTVYLNSERPLWILQDQKEATDSPFKETLSEKNIKTPKYHNNRQQQQRLRNFKTKTDKRLSDKGVPLPHNYIPFRKERKANLTPPSRRYHNSKFLKNMPVFDAVPGAESLASARPIFIYTGNKGRMLFNTMLSAHKYPMQEPVPGQVLYPPPTLVFQPKPLVDNLQRKLNVTMLPFHAYEAIEPSHENHLTATATTTTTSFSTAKKSKKSKQYAAFFSPEQVHSQHHYHVEHTTNSPHTLEKPYGNHRLHTEPLLTTTPLPHKKFEVTYNDGADKFQITYEDDASTHLERPLNAQTSTTTSSSSKSALPYESYTIDNQYYAFPVYTMAKLMENDDTGQGLAKTNTQQSVSGSVERESFEKYIDSELQKEHNSLLNNSNEDTWFILNSRYKGPLKTKTKNLHSSKYVQTSPAKMQKDGTKNISLYGGTIDII